MNDLNKIIQDLQEYPQHIHMAAMAAEDLREAWDQIKVRRDFEFAGAFLKSKADEFTDGEARQKATQEVYVVDKEAIAAESAYRRAVADLDKMNNEFTAIRKHANLIETQMQTLRSEPA